MMQLPIKWSDEYYVSKDRIVLTPEQIHIPTIKVFGHHVMSCAISPLVSHYHENCFEFTVITDGVFIFHTDQHRYKVSGGDVFIAYPNEPHSTDETPLSHGEFYWIQLDVSSAKDFLFLDEDAAENLISRLNQIKHRIIKIKDRSTLKLLKSAFELTTKPNSEYLISSYLVLFLNLLAESSAAAPASLSWGIYEAISYINEHIAQEISLEKLAECSCLSVSQFKTRFKQEIGISPRSYVNMQKVERAKEMLLSGKSITETGFELSFNTSSYFSAIFKKYTFSTPTEFVEQNSVDLSQEGL